MNNKLKQLRKERNLTQVARAIGITTSAYSNYEQGIRKPTNDILVAICKFYKVSSDYLLNIEDL